MELSDQALNAVILVGALLLSALVLDAVGRRVGVPRVSLLILLGVLVGPAGFDIVNDERETLFPLLSTFALAMIGFLLGEEFTGRTIREYGRPALMVSVAQSALAAAAVAAGLLAFGYGAEVALPLAGVAAATDPASTLAVVQEQSSNGRFSRLLRGVVALDDIWGILIFSVLLAAATGIAGTGGTVTVLGEGIWEVAGAILLGVVAGVPAAYFTGRLQPGEPMLEEAIGIVLLVAGVALLLQVSFLLAAVVLGAVVANRATHHERPFHEIERVQWPFLVLFFVLAGASLELDELLAAGTLGAGYVILRLAGKVGGAWVGARLAGSPPEVGRWMGLALLPQASVALGLALAAAERFPETPILSVAAASTVLFELSGPLATRLALSRAEA